MQGGIQDLERGAITSGGAAVVEASASELGAVVVHLAELGHVAGDEDLERELGAVPAALLLLTKSRKIARVLRLSARLLFANHMVDEHTDH